MGVEDRPSTRAAKTKLRKGSYVLSPSSFDNHDAVSAEHARRSLRSKKNPIGSMQEEESDLFDEPYNEEDEDEEEREQRPLGKGKFMRRSSDTRIKSDPDNVLENGHAGHGLHSRHRNKDNNGEHDDEVEDEDEDDEVELDNVSKANLSTKPKREAKKVHDCDDDNDFIITDDIQSSQSQEVVEVEQSSRRDQSSKHPVIPDRKSSQHHPGTRIRKKSIIDDDDEDEEDADEEDDANDMDYEELDDDNIDEPAESRDQAEKSNGNGNLTVDDEYNLNSDTNERNENDKERDADVQQSKPSKHNPLMVRLPLHPESKIRENGKSERERSHGQKSRYGRSIKPVISSTPNDSNIKRDRSPSTGRHANTRQERYERRLSSRNDDVYDGKMGYGSQRRANKRRKTESSRRISYNEEDDDDDDGDFTGDRDHYQRTHSSKGNRRMSEVQNVPRRHTRRNARKLNSSNESLGASGAANRGRSRYPTRRQISANGAGKIGSRNSNPGISKDSDADVNDDIEYQASGAEESGDPSDDEALDEHEETGNENDSAGGSDAAQPAGRVLRSGKNGISTRNLRKQLPRRSVRRSSAPDNRNSFENEMRKSFRTRNESVRAADFYREDGDVSSDPSLSSDGENVRRPRRMRRQSATRAADAIAKNVDRTDFLSNPMAVTDDGKGARGKRPDRFGRQRNRRQPSSFDPYVSDDDNPQANVPIEPIEVDVNLSWDDIGGLDHHVRALKEMVFLPLLYPEVFEKFNMEAPRGVLFYGPPGTGKTLCARALAASCGAVEEEVDSTEASVPKVGTSKSNPITETPATQEAVPPSMGSTQDINVANPTDAGTNVASNPDVKESQATEDAEIRRTEQMNGEIGSAKEAEDNASKTAEEPTQSIVDAVKASHATYTMGGKEPDMQDNTKMVKKKPRVAFFMRNGADCLSKWVGEAERQLRMTFEAAKRHQPAIIFFDEIDGLAPVRSSKQDQIHSSIVSTLLGLMDGLDARGKIVVIGATNRVDAIDPALRRPGRFDRELIFTLPNMTARRKILGIHTSKWAPSPKEHVLDAVAKMTVGYCGADLKALCSESAIRALRRRYPQVYQSNHKLLIDVDQVRVGSKDFLTAMSNIVPASHRSAKTFARPLPQRLGAVLGESFNQCVAILKNIFPQGLPVTSMANPSSPNRTGLAGGSSHQQNVFNNISNGSVQGNGDNASDPPAGPDLDDYLSSSDDDVDLNDDTNQGTLDVNTMQSRISNAGRMRPTGKSSLSSGHVHQSLRPRLLISGAAGLGQGQLGPALLHLCEGCPVHPIDLTSLHSDLGARSPEEALMSAFREAARSVPSIVFLPHLELWWSSASQTLQTSLIIALKDIPADLPLLVLATAEEQVSMLPNEAVKLFGESFQLRPPSVAGRRQMFAPIVDAAKARPRISEAAARKRRRQRVAEVLPKAPPPPVKPPSAGELAQTVQSEERHIRTLRMEMREFLEMLLRDRKYKAFWTPVDPTLAPDYYDIIKIPMDLQKIAANIDKGTYPTVLAMVNDFDIMVKNAIQYNPPNTEVGALILRRAHGLIDVVHAWVDNLNQTLVDTCNKIVIDRLERKKRNDKDLTGDKAASATGDTETGGVEGENARNGTDVVMGDATAGDNNSSCPDKEVTADAVGADGANEGGRDAGDGGHERRTDMGKRVDVMDLDVIAPARNEKEICAVMPTNSNNTNNMHSNDDDDALIDDHFLPAQAVQISELETLLVDVSQNMTIDALEGLIVRCENVLHQFRHNMNRISAVRELSTTVCLARDDPSLFGNSLNN